MYLEKFNRSQIRYFFLWDAEKLYSLDTSWWGFQLDNDNQRGDSYNGGDFDDQVNDMENDVQRMMNDMHKGNFMKLMQRKSPIPTNTCMFKGEDKKFTRLLND